MNGVLFDTIFIGLGLVTCGYLLGKWRGYAVASSSIMNELFTNKLADPKEVLNFYANQGNARAQATLENLNKQRKHEFMINSRMDKDDAKD